MSGALSNKLARSAARRAVVAPAKVVKRNLHGTDKVLPKDTVMALRRLPMCCVASFSLFYFRLSLSAPNLHCTSSSRDLANPRCYVRY